MIKIFNFLKYIFFLKNKLYINQLNEIEWAHIYSESIRGNKMIENLNLNVGRWAGNYSFFYVLNRILFDFKPKNIVEFGLGESSKLISTYVDRFIPNSNHLIVEHDQSWIDFFNNRFILSKNSSILNLDLQTNFINGFKVTSYTPLPFCERPNFDLYVIDGPFGSDRFSRYDIISIVINFNHDSEFIILFDDTERRGELDTLNKIFDILTSKKIIFYTKHYKGNKQSTVICSEKFKFASSF